MKKFIIFCIGAISSFFRFNNIRACRFCPSCSEYSAEAFRTLSVPRAFYLMVKRILSCHPFSEGGYDPLPGTKSHFEARRAEKSPLGDFSLRSK